MSRFNAFIWRNERRSKVGEARVKLEAIGLNFIDIYQRTGLYSLPTPFT